MEEVTRMKPIKTDADRKKALAEIERLAILNPEADTDVGNRLEVLATLVEAYEKKHFPIEQPTPIEAIEFRTDQLGRSRKDLEEYIGSRSKVSEVLSGKRSLTLRMIRALSKGLDIPADVLLQESLLPELGLDWTRFPLQEMQRRGSSEKASENKRRARLRTVTCVRSDRPGSEPGGHVVQCLAPMRGQIRWKTPYEFAYFIADSTVM